MKLTFAQVRREDIPEDKMPAHFKDSDKTSEDEKYGTVRYYHIEAGDEVRENAAWYFDGEKAGDMKGWVGLRK